MRESIGGGLLFNLVITFVIIMIGVFVGSLAYSKAYKVKNRIINIIEDNKGYDEKEIESSLLEIGYRTNSSKRCGAIKINDQDYIDVSKSGYDYCVYQIPTNETKDGNYYYRVVTYMSIDIPLMGSLTFPVSGESKIIYDTYIDIKE